MEKESPFAKGSPSADTTCLKKPPAADTSRVLFFHICVCCQPYLCPGVINFCSRPKSIQVLNGTCFPDPSGNLPIRISFLSNSLLITCRAVCTRQRDENPSTCLTMTTLQRGHCNGHCYFEFHFLFSWFVDKT